MKKVLYIMIIAILLLAGCSKTVDNVKPLPDVPNPNGYMTEPQIFIGIGHQYRQEGWLDGESVELKENNIELQGDSFNLSIIFQGSIAEEKLREAVSVEGFEEKAAISIIPSEGKTVFYGNYADIIANKPYKLTISKDIADAEGKTLKADIQKEIILKPDVTAFYTLHGLYESYGDLGRIETMDQYAVGSMNLSLDPKTIEIDFSAPVDQKSVEDSIKQGLNDKGLQLGFEWSNAKKLTLKVDGFKSEEDMPYVISMSTAKDAEGNGVFGNLFFLTSKPNFLGAIDIKAKKDALLYKFPDKRYIAVQNGKVNNSIVLDDTEAKYIFNIAAKQQEKVDLNREYTLGIPNLGFVYSYLDSDTMILLNKIDGTVISYSTLDNSSKELFALPIEIIKSNVIEIAASPDGSKLAVVYETLPPGEQDKHDFIINVFDMSGNVVYTGKNLFTPRFHELFGSIANMKWWDNESLLLEDNLSLENQQDYNVISINIKTGKKSLMAEHAFRPALLPGKDLIKVESFKDYNSGERSIDIIKDGKKIKSFKAEPYQYDNFFFGDENILIYNENDKILAYDIDKGKSEALGNGYIIGLSENGSKVYYMTNHKMLYYID
ncbi:MAG TPA: hypothetical protein VEF53_21570 [Patescibacteria group bacterium]|nr:hypothetical protein [Patescibacteria group bacterium]